MNKLTVEIVEDELRIGPLHVAFHRTLRIPDNDETYPLPPSLGHFPLRRVADYRDRVPASWREHGGVFMPLYQREAMWLSFAHHRQWKPSAIKVAVGKVDALSGKSYSQRLHGTASKRGQDYIVVPGQPWLDGINAGSGYVRQFVAMPLGMGYTVEGQVTGEERHGGLQLCVFEPKPGRFPDAPPPAPESARMRSASGPGGAADALVAQSAVAAAAAPPAKGAEMGLAAGGRMKQSIYPDPHGVDTWDAGRYARCFVHIVNSELWTAITGEPAPPSPVSAAIYAQYGLPWFDLYDERRGDIAPARGLANVKSVAAKDAEHGFNMQDDDHLPIDPAVVVKLGPSGTKVPDGEW
jgi:hypothetical protein